MILQPNGKPGLADWQSDRDEIFFDVNVGNLDDGIGASDAQQDATGAAYGHYQFTSMWQQNVESATYSPQQWYHNAPYVMGYIIDGDEYVTEYAFPFSSFTIDTELQPGADETFQPADGVTFGLEVVVSDVDMADEPTDETFRKFLRWADCNCWENMDAAGEVTLSTSQP
ncbi:MAG: hypothetical protein HC906_14655, partial [Bacteroidales bacterium]|nr:hypothetical protein [Bacteroidales bacterium]